MRRFTDIVALVDDLLSRVEERGEARRLLAYPGDFRSVAEEDAFLAGLRSLEVDGALKAKRARVDGVNTLVHVTLGDLDKLYAFRKRTPAAAMSRSALRPVRDMPELPDAAPAVLDAIEASWSRNVAWSGLRQGEVDDLVAAIKLAAALGRLRGQAGEFVSVDYRTFSRRNTGDSKALERRTRLVVELFRRFFPEIEADRGLEDADLLASLGVERFAQPLLLGGTLAIDGAPLPATPFFGLPADQVRRLTVEKASYVLLVENYASFVRHCREVNGHSGGLIIYTGGFPARAVLGAIVSLISQSVCPVFHWGDIDLGGLRIFAHLERSLAGVGITLLPHLMDPAVLDKHGSSADRSMTPLPAHLTTSLIGPLWTFMAGLTRPVELEQEELDPAMPGQADAAA